MTDSLLALLPSYGGYLLALVTLLACMAMPIPASVLMVAAGGFAMTGDLLLWQALLGAFVGAVIGDQVGFQIGRLGTGYVERLEAKGGKQAAALKKATAFTRRRGVLSVFFSRWLVSPLGPYVNLTAGAARMNWAGFTIGSLLGEAVWVSIYIGMGAGAADKVAELEAKLAEKDAEIDALKSAPAPEPERIEVPVIPQIVNDTLAELAARAEALASDVEEKVKAEA